MWFIHFLSLLPKVISYLILTALYPDKTRSVVCDQYNGNKRTRSCFNSPNSFCCVCSQFVVKRQCRSITPSVKLAYNKHFGCRVGNQNKTWAPHIICVSCYVTLLEWAKGKRRFMKIAVPMVWREPTNHVHDVIFVSQ